MAEMLAQQNDLINSDLQQMKENFNQARQSHVESMKLLVEIQGLLIQNTSGIASISNCNDHFLPQYQVCNPNLHYSYEFEPPPAPPHVFRSPEPPPVLPTLDLCISTISAPHIFDKSPSRELMVKATELNPRYTTDSRHFDSSVSLFQSFDKICEKNSYVFVLPIFDGNDPRKWILKARNYFEFKNEVDADRIKLAGLHFEGKAQTWYRWFYEKCNENVEWKIFLHDLLVRFDDYEVDLCKLVNSLMIQQQGSVDEYEIEFLQAKEIAEYVYDFVFSEALIAHNFINGLKEEIRETIDWWSLKTLQGEVNWAKFQESQMEERMLFEANEEEYEMYEGMQHMFKANYAPGEAAGECVEDITTALQSLKVTNELVAVDILFAKFRKLEVPSRNHLISVQRETTFGGTSASPFDSSIAPSTFGNSTSIFGSASAQGTTSAFNTGLNFGNTQQSPLFQSSTPSIGQTNSAFGQTPSFGQTTSGFVQTNLINTPSTGFGNIFLTTPSLLTTSSSMGFSQPMSSQSSPFQLSQPSQNAGAFGNFGQTQAAGLSGFGGTSGSLFSQSNFGQSSQNTAVVQQAPVLNPFGTLHAMPLMSIGCAGTSPSIQYGISSLPVVDKPAPARISSLLTSRNLSQRTVRLSAKKYHPKNNGLKVSFFSDDDDTPITPKADTLFIPRENPRALVIRPLEQWPGRTNGENRSLSKEPTPVQENDEDIVKNGSSNEQSDHVKSTQRTVKEIKDSGLHIEIGCLDIKGVVLHTSENLVASNHGYSLGGWLLQLDRLDKQFNIIGKPNVRNFDPGGGICNVQAAFSNCDGGIKMEDLSLLDVAPLSLDLEMVHRVITYSVLRNSTILTVKKHVVSAYLDKQIGHPLCVLEGKGLRKNFKLFGTLPAQRGLLQIILCCDIDANENLLHIIVCCANDVNGEEITPNALETCAATFWRCMNIAEANDPAIDRIAVDRNRNFSETTKQYCMLPMGHKENLAKLLDTVFSWKIQADRKATDDSLEWEWLQYKQHTTSSDGLTLDEFKLFSAFALLKVSVTKDLGIAWYWSIVTLMFDPGDFDDCKIKIIFDNWYDSSLRTRMFLRGEYCHELDRDIVIGLDCCWAKEECWAKIEI